VVELLNLALDDPSAARSSREPVLSARRAAIAGRKIVDDHREEVADLMIATVDKYAPGCAPASRPPNAVATRSGTAVRTACGDIFPIGRADAEQFFSARPMLGHADYADR